MNDLMDFAQESFVFLFECMLFSMLAIYQALANLSVLLIHYLSNQGEGSKFLFPIVIVSSTIGYIFIIIYSYRKNFNDFTRVYSTKSRNIAAFVAEGGILSLFFLTTFTFFLRNISQSPNLHYFIPSLVLTPLVCFLLWVILEGFLFAKRWDIIALHRPNSLMILYFLFSKHNVDTSNAVDGTAQVSKASGNKTLTQDGYRAVSEGLEAQAQNNIKWVSLRSRKLGGAAHALRYHELYGKTPYIALFLRIILTPFIAIFISGVFATFAIVVLDGSGETVSSIYLYFQEISEALDAFFFFIFGPAFYPAEIGFGPFNGVYKPTEPMLEQLGELYAMQQIGMFLLIGSILLCSAKGAAMGILAQAFVWGYALLFAGMAYVAYTDTGDFSYFANFSKGIARAMEPEGIMNWVMRFSGMSSAFDQLPSIDDRSFALLMLPGVVFWILSAILVSCSINFTRAGALTFRKTLWLPYVSKGNLEVDDRQLELNLKGIDPHHAKVTQYEAKRKALSEAYEKLLAELKNYKVKDYGSWAGANVSTNIADFLRNELSLLEMSEIEIIRSVIDSLDADKADPWAKRGIDKLISALDEIEESPQR